MNPGNSESSDFAMSTIEQDALNGDFFQEIFADSFDSPKVIDSNHLSGVRENQLPENWNHFLQLPEKLVAALNEGDTALLTELVEVYFDENCAVRTESLNEMQANDLIGRDVVLRFFLALCNNIPDSVCVLKGVNYHFDSFMNPVLQVHTFFSGTEVTKDGDDVQLYKAFNPKTGGYDEEYVEKTVSSTVLLGKTVQSSELNSMRDKEQAVREGKALPFVKSEGFQRFIISQITKKISRAEFHWCITHFDTFKL